MGHRIEDGHRSESHIFIKSVIKMKKKKLAIVYMIKYTV
jgi:hypothetical protein